MAGAYLSRRRDGPGETAAHKSTGNRPAPHHSPPQARQQANRVNERARLLFISRMRGHARLPAPVISAVSGSEGPS
eukprot:358020-Chlamydomonas_euryale.AAC.14